MEKRPETASKRAVAKTSEVPPGRVLLAEAGGRRLVICNVDGEYYAVEDMCTHDGGPLGEGSLDGCCIECPRHGAQFDLRSGEVRRLPAAAPIKTFPVSVEGEDICVELP